MCAATKAGDTLRTAGAEPPERTCGQRLGNDLGSIGTRQGGNDSAIPWDPWGALGEGQGNAGGMIGGRLDGVRHLVRLESQVA
jgi:hypothetical protein